MNRFQKPKSVLSDVDDNQELCVKHMAGSSKYVPKDDDSWKDFWERKSNRRFPSRREKCPCCGEMTDADDFVGGHVVDVTNSMMKYICPVCKSCNSKYGQGKEESPAFYVNKADCIRWYQSESITV